MYQAASSSSSTLSHFDPITIGTDNRGDSIEWSFPAVSNFNALFMGVSGGGKTFTLQQLLARVFQRGMTFHVIDIKGDFGYENFEKSGLGHLVQPSDFNDIRFDYYDGSAINPLAIPRNKQAGGVMMTIEGMKQLVKNFAPNTGIKQLSYLGDILRDVYAKAGIDHDDESSWSKQPPTLDMVLDQIDLVFNTITSGLPSGTVSDIMQAFGKANSKASSTIAKMLGSEEGEAQIEEKVDEIANTLADLLKGHALSQINYKNIKGRKAAGSGAMWEFWSRESLFGLRSIIQDMVNCRLFTGVQSATKAGKINRYDLTEISPAHQQIIMRIVAARVFAMGVQETKRNDSFNPRYPSHIMVADEGKHIKEISQSSMSPFNRIGTEGRGYGVGAWLGVQQPDQVTNDLLRNFATYFLLKIPESSNVEVSRMFGVKPSLLKQLVPRENVLFSCGGSYSLVTHFKDM